MKKIFSILAATMMAVTVMAQEEEASKPVSFAYEAGAEIVSAYIWRGQYNGSLSFQPTASVGFDALDEAINKYATLSYDEIKEKSHDTAWRSTARDFSIKWEDIAREAGLDSEEMECINEFSALRAAKSSSHCVPVRNSRACIRFSAKCWKGWKSCGA